MNAASFILQQLRDHDGPLDAEAVNKACISMLNTPFFQSGGGADDITIVRRCFDEFNSLQHMGPAPKLYLGQVLKLGERWRRLGESTGGTASQRALLRYNSALLHSVVIEAINSTREDLDEEE